MDTETSIDDSSPTGGGRRRGQRVGPEALLLPVLGAAWWVLDGGFGAVDGGRGRPPVAVDDPPTVQVWSGRWSAEDGRALVARLTPLHADPTVQAFDARVLRARLRLPAGQPWRLELVGEGPSPASFRLDGLRLSADGAELLVPPDVARGGALGALFALPDGGSVRTAMQVGLWGPSPGGELLLEGLAVEGLGGTAVTLETVTLEEESQPADHLPRSLATLATAETRPADSGPEDVASGDASPSELEVARTRIQVLEEQVARLDRELTVSQDARLEREQAYVEFQRSLAGLPDGASLEEQVRMMLGLPAGNGAAPGSSGTRTDAEAEAPSTEDELAVAGERDLAEARARTLNVLLRSEGVWSLELLEAGDLLLEPSASDDAPGADTVGPEVGAGAEVASAPEVEPRAASAEPVDEATQALLEAPHSVGTGPVVFRQLDDRGRLAGGIRAASLRLEGSRAGRSLALVLEAGAFLEGGRERPFEGGTYRIELRHVDPEPFMAALPELFAPDDLERRVDDGRWSLPLVRTDLNRLLAGEIHGERYRLTWLGGVLGDELRDVELELRDAEGRPERRVFADAMVLDLDLESRTLVLRLRDGSTLRGSEKAPFLDGRMRIVVPRIDATAWADAALPGIGAPPEPREGGQ